MGLAQFVGLLLIGITIKLRNCFVSNTSKKIGLLSEKKIKTIGVIFMDINNYCYLGMSFSHFPARLAKYIHVCYVLELREHIALKSSRLICHHLEKLFRERHLLIKFKPNTPVLSACFYIFDGDLSRFCRILSSCQETGTLHGNYKYSKLSKKCYLVTYIVRV